ncbi:MAG: hypothetical protein AABZ06_11740 [Bdellovibrionota bacterium]
MPTLEKAYYNCEHSAKKGAIVCFLFSTGSAGAFLLLLLFWNEGGITKIVVLSLVSLFVFIPILFSIHLIRKGGRYHVEITRTSFVMESPSPVFGESRTIIISDIKEIQEEYLAEVGYDYYLVMKSGARIDISQFMTDSNLIMRTLKAINPEIRILQTGDRRKIPRFLRSIFRVPRLHSKRATKKNVNEPT